MGVLGSASLGAGMIFEISVGGKEEMIPIRMLPSALEGISENICAVSVSKNGH